MSCDVTVLTAHLPERWAMLAEAVASVQAQTLPPKAHWIAVDHQRRGTAATLNPLIHAVGTRWWCRLDDDDLWDPHHLATLAAHTDGADVVYSYCRGGPAQVNRPFDPAALRRGNYIPAVALVRTAAALEAGLPDGYAEDWQLWLRLADAGATFRCVPEVTWTYRRGGWWRKTPNRARGAA